MVTQPQSPAPADPKLGRPPRMDPLRADPWRLKEGDGVHRFIEVHYPEPHRGRARDILRNHPEVRDLFGRNPATAWVLLGVVAAQVAAAWLLRDSAWWAVALAAWFGGAFANHALFVLIHEVSHNLIFKKRSLNQAAGLVANMPMFVPSAASFCIYHLKHHQYQGDYNLDADLASGKEAKIIGNSSVGKLMWELFFPIFQSVRTVRFSKTGKIPFYQPWVIANWLVQFGFDTFIFVAFGPSALLYLALSLFFSIGLHPLGARWIQEHFVVREGQETYSYYGPLNAVALNVGYHNEHHDFPFVAWNRLPKLKALAPEMYEPLYSHDSWTALWLRFLRDRKLSLFSRVVRDGRINGQRRTRSKDTYAPDTLDEDLDGAVA